MRRNKIDKIQLYQNKVIKDDKTRHYNNTQKYENQVDLNKL